MFLLKTYRTTNFQIHGSFLTADSSLLKIINSMVKLGVAKQDERPAYFKYMRQSNPGEQCYP
jgi:hypothetical protein